MDSTKVVQIFLQRFYWNCPASATTHHRTTASVNKQETENGNRRSSNQRRRTLKILVSQCTTTNRLNCSSFIIIFMVNTASGIVASTATAIDNEVVQRCTTSFDEITRFTAKWKWIVECHTQCTIRCLCKYQKQFIFIRSPFNDQTLEWEWNRVV